MRIGTIIKNYRSDHNLSIREFSEMSGVSRAYLGQIENDTDNTRKLTLDKLQGICQAMNSSLDDIMAMMEDKADEVLECNRQTAVTGELIRKLRLEKGWTQEELGKMLGVQKSAVAKYESGRVENLKRATIRKLSDLFNVSPVFFVAMESHTSSRLQEALKLRNMTQNELSAKTGISKGAISSYVSGRYEPKQNNIYLLSKALDINEAWLMGLDVPMEGTNVNRNGHPIDPQWGNDEANKTLISLKRPDLLPMYAEATSSDILNIMFMHKNFDRCLQPDEVLKLLVTLDFLPKMIGLVDL